MMLKISYHDNWLFRRFLSRERTMPNDFDDAHAGPAFMSQKLKQAVFWVIPWVLMVVLFVPSTVLISKAYPNPVAMAKIAAHYSATFLPWILFSPIVYRQTARRLLRLPLDFSTGIFHTERWLGIVLIHGVFLAGADVLGIDAYGNSTSSFLARYLGAVSHVAPLDFVIYIAVAGVFSAWEAMNRLQARERSFARSQLDALRSQLQPHFLYNALNAISELVYRDASAADTALLRLAKLLRRFAEQKDLTHSLDDELTVLEEYVGIQQILLGEKLKVNWHVDYAALQALVPTMLLQPILENAIQHGVALLRAGGTVSLSAKLKDDRLVLDITNDGPIRGDAVVEGVGLTNARERMKALYGADHRMTLIRTPTGGALVSITVPATADGGLS
jgi:Histidine kinase